MSARSHLAVVLIVDEPQQEPQSPTSRVQPRVSRTHLPDAIVRRCPATAPVQLKDVRYPSSADKTDQPALWYSPPGNDAVPLLVALHTWSGNYKQSDPASAAWCAAKGWAMIRPDFRGPNQRPEACGSELAVQDVLSA